MRGVGELATFASIVLLAACTDDPGSSPPILSGTDDGVAETGTGPDVGEPIEVPPYAPLLVDATAEAGLPVGTPWRPSGPCLLEDVWNETADTPLFSSDPCHADLTTGSVLVGDFDGDGFEDLYLGRVDTGGSLFRNLGDGTFVDVTQQMGLADPVPNNGGAFFDADGDGDRDLLLLAWGAEAHQLWRNDGDTFTQVAEAAGLALTTVGGVHLSTSAAIGDYDGDGWLDVFITEWSPSFLDPTTTRLMRNLGVPGGLAFEDVTDAAGLATVGQHPDGTWAFAGAFVDLDDDAWPDLAVSSDFGTSEVYWNAGDGTFAALDQTATGLGLDDFGMGSALADFDRDGDFDWFVTSVRDPLSSCEPDVDCANVNGNRLYRNDGGRTFSEVAFEVGVDDAAWGWGAAWVDLDDDGRPELLATNGFDDPLAPLPQFQRDRNRLWHFDAPGGVAEDIARAAGFDDDLPGRALVTIDYDRDGDRDVIIAVNGGGVILYRNDGAEVQGHWLDVRVTVDGRPAWGASVELDRDGTQPPQWRRLGTKGHVFGQSSTDAHFGLGTSDAAVATIRVELPGHPDIERVDVPVDQVIDIEF